LRRENLSFFNLGASLYIPATHKNLYSTIFENRFPHLKSLIICLEDSINDDEVEFAEEKLKYILQKLDRNRELLIFLRPRSFRHFQKLLSFNHIDRIDGFVIPKFNLEEFHRWRHYFFEDFYFMPTFENEVVFDEIELRKIRNELLQFKDSILNLRIGSEDIGKLLGIKRGCQKTVYEIPIFTKVITDLIAIFKPKGFHLSSPVFSCFKDYETLQREVLSDLENGLFSKSAIHPKQVEIIQNIYRVSENELQIAEKVVLDERAIFSQNGLMLEKRTHAVWADNLLRRAKLFGKH
jgi:citrate lyase beta subunit